MRRPLVAYPPPCSDESEKSFEEILQNLPKHFGQNWVSDDEFDGARGKHIEEDGARTRDNETIVCVFYNYDGGQLRAGGERKADEKNTTRPRNPGETGRGFLLKFG